MARTLPFTQLSAILFLVCFAGLARSDFAQDKAECADKLVSLATCLTYLQGKAKAPTPDCCSGLKQLVDKSKKCLCILVKDRNDPGLGYKFNATLALGLPKACGTSVNGTECIGMNLNFIEHLRDLAVIQAVSWGLIGFINLCSDILHLSPNAPEAQVFKQISSGGPPAAGNSSAKDIGTASSSGRGASSDGGQGKIRMLTEMVFGISVWCLVSIMVLGG
ncbi:hypothetical protein ACLOJK_028602 [Asimina triloba]